MPVALYLRSKPPVLSNEKLQKLLLFLFPALALVPPVLERVRGLNSPEMTQSVVFVVAIFCAILGGILLCLDHGNWKRNVYAQLLKTTIISLVVFSYIDIGYAGYHLVEDLFPFLGGYARWEKVPVQIIFVLASVFIIWLFIWKLKTIFTNILYVFFSVAFLSSFFVTGHESTESVSGNFVRGEKSGDSSLDIFIVLDGMIGVDGIDLDVPGGKEFYDYALTFHESNGFTLFGKAFSRHSNTLASIPSNLNFNYNGLAKTGSDVQATDGTTDLVSNRLFDRFSADGRDILVYQTPFLNFCRHTAVVFCETLEIHNPYNGYMPPVLQDRALMFTLVTLKEITQNTLIYKYLALALYRAAGMYQRNFGDRRFVPDNAEYAALSLPRFFDKLIADVTRNGGGVTYFAHFIAPHAPYVLDSECMLQKDWPSFPRSLTEHQGLKGAEFQAARVAHHVKYYEQAACVYKKLDELMDALRKEGLLEGATIVLMGDHGSRISAGDAIEYLTSRDLVDNYSTLFSVLGGPGGSVGQTTMVSTQQLLSILFDEAYD